MTSPSRRKPLGSGPRATISCPHCRATQTQVIDAEGSNNNTIRRRRICRQCDHRFTTWEGEAPTGREEGEAIGELKAELGLLVEEMERLVGKVKVVVGGDGG